MKIINPKLSSENSFLTKMLDYQDANSLKKLLKTPNLDEDKIKQILADYNPSNWYFLQNKLLQAQIDLQSKIDFEFDQTAKDLAYLFFQTSQITTNLVNQIKNPIF